MKKIIFVLIGLVCFHLLILSKLQFTAWPEMLSFPYMVDKGFLIYRDFHHVYEPLLTFILSVFYKFSGFSASSLKIFTWTAVVLVDLLVFVVSRQIFGKKLLSLVPVAIFIILQPAFEGNMLWFDLALTIPILISIYFVFRWSQEKKWFYIFLTSFFLSVGFLVKQQAVMIYLPFIIYILVKRISFRQFLVFAFGGVIPITVLLVFLVVKGNLSDYFFWTLELPLYWLPKIPGYKVLPVLKEWEIIVLMVLTPLLYVISRIIKFRENINFIFLFFVFLLELVSAFPRFSFFHLQPAVATFAIICGYLFSNRNITILLFSIASLLFIGIYRWKLVFPEFKQETRFYGDSEVHLAQYIDSVTKPGDEIYLLGPNATSYVIANRVPPKPWIENYVWHFEIPGVQDKVIAGWEHSPPKVIFWTPPQPGNWYDLGTYQPKKITDWIKKNYVNKEETKSGVEVWYFKTK